MPRPKKSEPQMFETRQQILDASFAILLENGPEGISLRPIAARLGITHMALFTYFSGQSAILQALVERELARLQTRLAPFVERARRLEPNGVLREALYFFAVFARENPALYRLLWLAPFEVRPSSNSSRVSLEPVLHPLAQIIEAGIERGAFEARGPSLAAGVVFGMVNAPLMLFYGGRLESAGLCDRLVAEALDAAQRYLKRDASFIKGKWN